MYFRVNLKMKKQMLCCCFKWIVVIELNFTVAFLLIRKTWNDWFAGKVGMGNFKKWRDPSNEGNDFDMGGGGWYSFTDYGCKLKYLPTIKKLKINK